MPSITFPTTCCSPAWKKIAYRLSQKLSWIHQNGPMLSQTCPRGHLFHFEIFQHARLAKTTLSIYQVNLSIATMPQGSCRTTGSFLAIPTRQCVRRSTAFRLSFLRASTCRHRQNSAFKRPTSRGGSIEGLRLLISGSYISPT